MILPAPRSTIRFPISRLMTNCAFRLVSMTWSQYSSGCSAAGLRRIVPALFTRMSITGKSACARCRKVLTASRFPKSHV